MLEAVPLIVTVAVTVRGPTKALENVPFVAVQVTFAASAPTTPDSVQLMFAFGSVVVLS